MALIVHKIRRTHCRKQIRAEISDWERNKGLLRLGQKEKPNRFCPEFRQPVAPTGCKKKMGRDGLFRVVLGERKGVGEVKRLFIYLVALEAAFAFSKQALRARHAFATKGACRVQEILSFGQVDLRTSTSSACCIGWSRRRWGCSLCRRRAVLRRLFAA
jgi:hypothetical protein